MKHLREFITSTIIGGLFVVVPIYLAVLLLLKGMQSVGALVKPIAALLPDGMRAEGLIALLLVLAICFLVGVLVRTQVGKAAGQHLDALCGKLPGYDMLRSLTRRLAGASDQEAWKPALAEIEEALVPAFIIEELADGRFTVFVPSIPTPFAGAVYILDRARVHPVDVPFTQAVRSISRWGSGSKDLVAAMRKQ